MSLSAIFDPRALSSTRDLESKRAKYRREKPRESEGAQTYEQDEEVGYTGKNFYFMALSQEASKNSIQWS